MEARYPRRITRRIILYIVIVSAVVGLLAAAVQVHDEYERNSSELERVLSDVENTIRGGVAQALWVHDLTQLRILVNGIIQHRDFARVEIHENDTVMLATGRTVVPANTEQRIFPIEYERNGKPVTIGVLALTIDLDGGYQRLIARARMILFWSALQTFFVAIFAYFIFSHLLTRHVQGIAGYLKNMDLGGADEALCLERVPNRSNRRDELDMLVFAINDLRDRFNASQVAVQSGREELEASERRYRAILDEMLDTFYRTDVDGRITMVSPSAEQLLGWSLDEVIGKQLADFYVDPDGREKFLAEFNKSGGEIHGYEDRLRRKDGGIVWVSTSARMIRDENGDFAGVEGIGRDITAQRKAAEAVRESEKQLRLVADSLPALVLYVDKTLHFRFANKEAASWYSRTPEEVLQMEALMVLDEASTKRLQARWDGVLQGEVQAFSEIFTYPDGKTRHVELRFVPDKRDDGTVEGFFALGIDVTQKKTLEDRLRQSQKMEALGQLTGGVAHDFNNLLGVIMGNVELLLEEPQMSTAESNELLDAVFRVAERGSRLTRQLLTFSRQQPLMQSSTSLDTELTSFAGMLQRTLGEGVAIEISYMADLWPCLVDRPMLENALLNLALNSRDAMNGAGSLIITIGNVDASDPVEAERLELAPGHYVSVAVTDNGVGMPADVVAHAFEPFYTTKDVGSGTGLGLSMVYGFARQSNGSVSISSVEGEGTTAVMYLPRAEAAISQGKVVHAEDQAGDIQGAGERILIVEDDPDMRRIAADTLDRLGYSVEVAEDGASALELLRNASSFDLVLTDIRLPHGMLGPEVARQALLIDPALKVAYMTGYADAALLEGGALDESAIVLRKPFRRADLAAAMDQVLNHETTPDRS